MARRGGQERRVGEVGRKGGEAARLEPPLPLHDRRLLCGQLLIFPFNLYTYCRGLVASGAAPLSVVHTVILKACPD